MVPPVPFTRLVGPALTTSFVEVSESTYERGFEQPLHAHDPAYITAVLSGSYQEITGNTTRNVAQGALRLRRRLTTAWGISSTRPRHDFS